MNDLSMFAIIPFAVVGIVILIKVAKDHDHTA